MPRKATVQPQFNHCSTTKIEIEVEVEIKIKIEIEIEVEVKMDVASTRSVLFD